jgi:uncharacterized protein (TIGR03437 family)
MHSGRPHWSKVEPNNGQFSTQLGGTSVSFNGTLAPILYTSEMQVAVMAPLLR